MSNEQIKNPLYISAADLWDELATLVYCLSTDSMGERQQKKSRALRIARQAQAKLIELVQRLEDPNEGL